MKELKREKYHRLYEKGWKVKDIAKKFGVAECSVYSGLWRVRNLKRRTERKPRCFTERTLAAARKYKFDARLVTDAYRKVCAERELLLRLRSYIKADDPRLHP